MRLRSFAIAALVAALFAVAPFAAASAGDDPTQACPACSRLVSTSFRFCPFDGAELPTPGCSICERPMQRGWRFCPWDGTGLAAGAGPAAGAAGAGTSTSTLPGAAAAAPVRSADARAAEGAAAREGAGAAATSPAAAAPAVPPARANPMTVVDRLFQAISREDANTLRTLYDWERFFPESTDLEADRARYVTHILAQRPQIEGRRRVPMKVKLGESDSQLTVGLVNPESLEVDVIYDFHLLDDGRGWRIVAIAP